MSEKALFTFEFEGTTFGVFEGDFIQGGGMGFNASALTGGALEAFKAADEEYWLAFLKPSED